MLSRGRPPGRPPGWLRAKPACHPTLGIAFAVQTLPTASISALDARRWWPAGGLPPRCSPRTISTFSPPIFPTWTSLTTTPPATSTRFSNPATSSPPRSTRRVTFKNDAPCQEADPRISSCPATSSPMTIATTSSPSPTTIMIEKRIVALESTLEATLQHMNKYVDMVGDNTSVSRESFSMMRSLASSVNTLEMRIAATEDKLLSSTNSAPPLPTTTDYDPNAAVLAIIDVYHGAIRDEDSDNDDLGSTASDDETVYGFFKREYLQREGPEALANLSEDSCKKEMALWKKKHAWKRKKKEFGKLNSLRMSQISSSHQPFNQSPSFKLETN